MGLARHFFLAGGAFLPPASWPAGGAAADFFFPNFSQEGSLRAMQVPRPTPNPD